MSVHLAKEELFLLLSSLLSVLWCTGRPKGSLQILSSISTQFKFPKKNKIYFIYIYAPCSGSLAVPYQEQKHRLSGVPDKRVEIHWPWTQVFQPYNLMCNVLLDAPPPLSNRNQEGLVRPRPLVGAETAMAPAAGLDPG